MNNGSLIKSVSKVMGKNFWGFDDWLNFYDVNFTEKQLDSMANFPWNEGVLNSDCLLCNKIVKDCHFAFLGSDFINDEPLTIMKLQGLYPATGQPKFASYASNSWYSEEKFAREVTMSLKWHLLHQNIVSESEGKTFNDQKAMLAANYEVPPAITEVTKNMLVFLKTGNFVNSSRYARCGCVTLSGIRVFTGFFNSKYGLYIDGDWFGGRCGIGVSASRIPSK